jgi:hypothetical protein
MLQQHPRKKEIKGHGRPVIAGTRLRTDKPDDHDHQNGSINRGAQSL